MPRGRRGKSPISGRGIAFNPWPIDKLSPELLALARRLGQDEMVERASVYWIE
jgi:hypothetical protein